MSNFSPDKVCMETNKLRHNNTKQQLILCKVIFYVFLIKVTLSGMKCALLLPPAKATKYLSFDSHCNDIV